MTDFTGGRFKTLCKTYFWVGITVKAVASPNVHLVLCGFLINGVMKVDGVGAPQPVVPP